MPRDVELVVRLVPYPGVSLGASVERIGERVAEYFAGLSGAAEARTIEVRVVELAGVLEGPPWLLTTARLASDLAGLSPSTAGDWQVDVLVGRSAESTTTFGVMFDEPGRRGCAVFTEAIRFNYAEEHFEPVLVRTIAHEVGHALNLCHVPQEGCLMSAGGPRIEDLSSRTVAVESRRHLAWHPCPSVRPGARVFGDCEVTIEHLTSICVATDSSDIDDWWKVQLGLAAHAGLAHPEAVRPTLVVGEPLHLTLTLVNRSRRAVRYPLNTTSQHQAIRIERRGGDGPVSLTPPALCCDSRGQGAWRRLEAGRSGCFHESLLHRRGGLVFPRPGEYSLVAKLWIKSRWVSSQPVAVRVVPPEKRRHRTSVALARTPECSLLLELGGGAHLPVGYAALRRLLRDNPDFPLNAMTRLVLCRAAAFGGRAPYPGWRSSLARVAADSRLPPFVRREANLLLAERGPSVPPDEELEHDLPVASVRRLRCLSSSLDRPKEPAS